MGKSGGWRDRENRAVNNCVSDRQQDSEKRGRVPNSVCDVLIDQSHTQRCET